MFKVPPFGVSHHIYHVCELPCLIYLRFSFKYIYHYGNFVLKSAETTLLNLKYKVTMAL